MRKFIINLSIITIMSLLTSSCARDLSSHVYTSDSTLNLTLQGQVVAVRSIIIKEHDKLSDNTGGTLAGGASGALLGANTGNGNSATIIGGAAAGAIIGAIAQDKLGQNKGYEYIIKINPTDIKSDYYEGSGAMRAAISAATTGGLITVVQGAKNQINVGQNVYVIFSDKRTRVIPAS